MKPSFTSGILNSMKTKKQSEIPFNFPSKTVERTSDFRRCHNKLNKIISKTKIYYFQNLVVKTSITKS